MRNRNGLLILSTADKNINLEAGQDVNIKAAGDNIGTSYEGIGGPNDFNGPKGIRR